MTYKKKKLFDFISDINTGKTNILRNEPDAIKDYSPWIVNIGMSLYEDTILYANDLNQYYRLSKVQQYDYYMHAIRKRKRYAKWPKKPKSDTDAKIIAKVFCINISHAEQYIELMDKTILKDILNKHTNFGGR